MDEFFIKNVLMVPKAFTLTGSTYECIVFLQGYASGYCSHYSRGDDNIWFRFCKWIFFNEIGVKSGGIEKFKEIEKKNSGLTCEYLLVKLDEFIEISQ